MLRQQNPPDSRGINEFEAGSLYFTVAETDASTGFNRVAQAMIVITVFFLSWSFIFLKQTSIYITIVLLVCIFAFLFSISLSNWILSADNGTAEMRRVSDAIKEGSEGFLRVQYGTIFRMALVVSCFLFGIYLFRMPSPEVPVSQVTLAFFTVSSFLLGAGCSGLAGYFGVWTSVRANIRVAAAAARGSAADALKLAFCGGAMSSIISAAMCILGITILYCVFYTVIVVQYGLKENLVPILLAGYGFGASFVALFMQLGGGIYTKAADVGADLIGKVESNIPEDDPRNPAVIADLVGDNVGDCAGSMADVFESIAAEIIGTMILGQSLAHEAKIEHFQPFVFFPLLIHAFDLVVSSIGIYIVKCASAAECENPLGIMKKAYAVSMVFAITGFFAATRWLLYVPEAPYAWWHFSFCGVVGIIASYFLVIITQYYTDYAYGPVRSIALSSTTGHGTNIITGVSVGMESTALPIIVIAISILTAHQLGVTSGLPANTAGLFGTAAATMGMLCTAVFVLSMNNFGPISDNAGGVVEMSELPESARVITDHLDAVGNVTKAATKGYSVGSSAMACFVLFRAYMDEIALFTGKPFEVVNIATMEVMVGGLLGIMMIFLFSGWAMAAVSKTAQEVVREVRRQFKDCPGIMDGTDRPDYNTCVAIVTKAALLEMVKPAVLALGFPVVIGMVFKYVGHWTGRPMLGVEVLAGMLMFGTLTALTMALFLDNSGGAWDNAKKFIEAGAHGGKGSDSHKAAVTGDTVGDPFKDTAGPALHVIITTMSTTILVLGPMFLNH